MKKINILLSIIISLLFIKTVSANDIKKITMNIFIDSNGNAHIKEVWDASLNKGTEGYKQYYNLGNSQITNFKVEMNGTNFTTIDSWNIDASFENKKYKAGINKVSEGYELCFGISKYGNNTYTMEYEISNFVSEIDDADMVYWNLIPKDLTDKPEHYYIKIYSSFEYSDKLDVWGYGKYGAYAYVYDGYIELTSDNGLDDDEYVTVLVKFPKGTFHLTNKLDNNFQYYYDMAEDGAVNYNDKMTIGEIIGLILGILFGLVMPIIIIIFVIKNVNFSQYGTKKLKFGKGARNLKDAPYFRDIPCNKNIFEAYWLACQYNLVKNKNDFLGTILLKWLKNHNIENVTVATKIKILKKEERAIKLISNEGLNELELELYNMMNLASGDGILESNEFTKWCKNNYNQILRWFNKVIDDETMSFVKKGKIIEEKKTFTKVYKVSDEMKEPAMQMAGLKKFLNEFSNINNRESIEVVHWEEYLMYAQIFGIAKKVAKEFKKLYPDVLTDDYYNDIIFIHTISYDGVHAASVAKSRAENYSAGGGGFSSGGGGGGSFGGGGGGFR